MDWNLTDPVSVTPTLNGYVYTGARDARNNNPPFFDTNGIRSMGYYEHNDLNYYYYMASQFATSDRWFAPVMSRTQSSSRSTCYPATSAQELPDQTATSSTRDIAFRLL